MGEYGRIKSTGERIKLGTCENMYYLRADQAHLIQHEDGNVDPIKDAAHIRFRFPFPSEDNVSPGAFNDHDRAHPVWSVTAPDIDHSIVQFVASAGYNVCLPCPESTTPATHGLKVHRNGFRGAVRIVQQRAGEGRLVLVCECGGCGARYRLPTLEDAEPIVVSLRSEADRELKGNNPDEYRSRYLNTMADRILAGYLNPPAWIAQTVNV